MPCVVISEGRTRLEHRVVGLGRIVLYRHTRIIAGGIVVRDQERGILIRGRGNPNISGRCAASVSPYAGIPNPISAGGAIALSKSINAPRAAATDSDAAFAHDANAVAARAINTIATKTRAINAIAARARAINAIV